MTPPRVPLRSTSATFLLPRPESRVSCRSFAAALTCLDDFSTGRLLRDAKLYEIGAGTSEIRRMLIGREIFEKTR